MKDLLILIAHLLITIAKLLEPGGARAIVADSLLTKQPLLIINRTRRRSPKLTALDCVHCELQTIEETGFLSDWWSPRPPIHPAVSNF